MRERKYGGNTKAMAAADGVAPRTVLRWIDGTRHPKGADAERLQREAVDVQTTERGRERRARQLAQRGTVSGIGARVGRAVSFEIRGSDAVRARDLHLNLSGEQAAALALAEDEVEVRQIVGQALADYFNGGVGYGGFSAGDFDFDPTTSTSTDRQDWASTRDCRLGSQRLSISAAGILGTWNSSTPRACGGCPIHLTRRCQGRSAIAPTGLN
ncbi:hypothetical protein KV557_33355 [Kitasatospora aureofaciens]|uniref:hypothetical protein n=1 Tax=Kitasatospora aureofaciens TaxID=1894 RepID=UPI001C43AE53|nr:hypothetical protein [Kitasatospora aureofaciens]MBV6701937.1 hypothetical protein [Kitasatospora aureofaciens]